METKNEITLLLSLLHERLRVLCQLKHKSFRGHRDGKIETRIRKIKSAIKTIEEELLCK